MRTMKILISISLSVFLFGCMGPDYRATDYSLGKLRHQITIGGNSMISRDEVKDAWYERARELCVDGFVVEEINE